MNWTPATLIGPHPAPISFLTIPLSPFFACPPGRATHLSRAQSRDTQFSLCVVKCAPATPFLSRACALLHFPYPVTPVFVTHTKTAGCVPTIPILELVAANLRRRDEKPVPANPLESVLTNCDARKPSRMCFYENCRVSLLSLSGDLKFYLNFLSFVRARSRWGFGHPHILVGAAVVKQKPVAMADHALDEGNVGDLANLLPFLFRRKDGRVGPRKQLS